MLSVLDVTFTDGFRDCCLEQCFISRCSGDPLCLERRVGVTKIPGPQPGPIESASLGTSWPATQVTQTSFKIRNH